MRALSFSGSWWPFANAACHASKQKLSGQAYNKYEYQVVILYLYLSINKGLPVQPHMKESGRPVGQAERIVVPIARRRK